jgi:large subunit ribosomal protein L18
MNPDRRKRRHIRIRHRVNGTATRPRVSVFRSASRIAVQLIDDEAGQTLLSATTQTVTASDQRTRAGLLGKELAKEAQKKGISTVVFDRGGYTYHGRVKAVADGLREGGLSV